MGYIKVDDNNMLNCGMDIYDLKVLQTDPTTIAVYVTYNVDMGSNKLLKVRITYLGGEEEQVATPLSNITSLWRDLIVEMSNQPGIVDAPVIYNNTGTINVPSFEIGISASGLPGLP